MPISVASPAPYAPLNAIGFSQPDLSVSPVSDGKPLPVRIVAPTPSAALAGDTASTIQVGPFTPAAGLPIMLTLAGTWSGTVRVLRSNNGGATRFPLTAAGLAWGQYTANCCEPVWEESVSGSTLYLDITLASGTVTYRMEQ
ncbi:MAG: hypothetical protein GXC70_03330 [Sphingomonadaceae bacterium]|nr:hypothetical protein [Sphingomonadaceae bacterium]